MRRYIQEQIRTHSQQLAKQIEASLGLRHQLGVPPISQSVVGDLNQTADICQPLSLPLGWEHPGTVGAKDWQLRPGSDGMTTGAPADGTEQPNYSLDFRTHEPAMAPILDLPRCPHDHAHTPGDGVWT